jgi:hypothetical protein
MENISLRHVGVDGLTPHERVSWLQAAAPYHAPLSLPNFRPARLDRRWPPRSPAPLASVTFRCGPRVAMDRKIAIRFEHSLALAPRDSVLVA